ncbi:MAG: hypothetical protein K0S74_529 [Chlamydiales bacterium]|jgi:hypothetical protein|nr:hypothetical protein [Chlamydiales bacterium]
MDVNKMAFFMAISNLAKKWLSIDCYRTKSVNVT